MSGYVTVSEAAREIGRKAGVVISPRTISDLFYKRLLRDDLCPIVGGRRLIPRDYLPDIEAVLRQPDRGNASKEADHAD